MSLSTCKLQTWVTATQKPKILCIMLMVLCQLASASMTIQELKKFIDEVSDNLADKYKDHDRIVIELRGKQRHVDLVPIIAQKIREFADSAVLVTGASSKQVNGTYMKVNWKKLRHLTRTDKLFGVNLAQLNIHDKIYIQTRKDSNMMLVNRPVYFHGDTKLAAKRGPRGRWSLIEIHPDATGGVRQVQHHHSSSCLPNVVSNDLTWFNAMDSAAYIPCHAEFTVQVFNNDPSMTQSSKGGISQLAPPIHEAGLRQRRSSRRSARENAQPTAPDGEATLTWAQRCGRGIRRVAQILCPNQED